MSPTWVFLVAFLISAAAGQSSEEDATTYSGSQVLKVLKDPKGLIDKMVSKLGLNVWSGNRTHLDVFVPAENVEEIKQNLRSNRIVFRTMIQDVQTAIEQENPRSSRRDGTSKMNWQNFQRLDVIHRYLDNLAKMHPSYVSTGIMGYSHEKRPLKYIKISSGKPNAKAVFIDGGIHAREWVAPASVTYIIKELVANRKNLPKELLDIDFYILPVFNPDGYQYTHTRDRMWRKNRSPGSRCSGADINRNFDFEFGGKGTSGSECDETYRGKSAASELETQAMKTFLTSIRENLKAYITFHSYGQYILIPYGYDNRRPAKNFSAMKQVGDAAASAMRKIEGKSYTVGNTADTLYPAAGGSDDWAKAELDVPYAYCIELRDTGDYGFILPAKYIIPTAKEAFEAIKVIAQAAAKA